MAAEKNFENKIKKYLESKHCWYVKFFANAFTKSGVPDILCCHKGAFIGIEVKASNGRPSPLQIHNLKKIDESGGYAILLYPKDWELFKNFIDRMYCGDMEGAFLNYQLLKERWCKLCNVHIQE